MQNLNSLVPASLLAIAMLASAGCSDSDYKGGAVTAPPPVAAKSDFSSFVVSQFAASASTETAPSVDVEKIDFSFVDDNNPTAFNSVIATAP